MDPRDDLLKLENQLCFALVTAARNVVALYRPVLEPLGLTHPQYLVMLALWESSPRSLGELADELAHGAGDAVAARQATRGTGPGDPGAPRRRRARARDRAHRRRASRCAPAHSRFRRQIMQRTGMDAAQLAALRDALTPFAGRRDRAAAMSSGANSRPTSGRAAKATRTGVGGPA